MLLQRLGWPALALTVSIILTLLFWGALRRWAPETASAAGWFGVFVAFGQTLDGVTTIIAIDVLGFVEQVPLSRRVLDLAGQLPTADLVGVGWALLGLKLVLTTGLVVSSRSGGASRHRFGAVALLVAGTAGLVPGITNLLLQATV